LTFSLLTSHLLFRFSNPPRAWSPFSSFQNWWKRVIDCLRFKICHINRKKILFVRIGVVFCFASRSHRQVCWGLMVPAITLFCLLDHIASTKKGRSFFIRCVAVQIMRRRDLQAVALVLFVCFLLVYSLSPRRGMQTKERQTKPAAAPACKPEHKKSSAPSVRCAQIAGYGGSIG
jgi:hypothetical protein